MLVVRDGCPRCNGPIFQWEYRSCLHCGWAGPTHTPTLIERRLAEKEPGRHLLDRSARDQGGRRRSLGPRLLTCGDRPAGGAALHGGGGAGGGGVLTPMNLWFLMTLLRCGYLPNNLRTRMAIARAQR